MTDQIRAHLASQREHYLRLSNYYQLIGSWHFAKYFLDLAKELEHVH